MAYRIRTKDDDVEQAVRRIACEQIDRALAEIDDDGLDFARKVHQVRKRCKKLRGLVRLVRPALDAYGRENAAFRDAAGGRIKSPVELIIGTYRTIGVPPMIASGSRIT